VDPLEEDEGEERGDVLRVDSEEVVGAVELGEEGSKARTASVSLIRRSSSNAAFSAWMSAQRPWSVCES
jgi:hypothetical protein